MKRITRIAVLVFLTSGSVACSGGGAARGPAGAASRERASTDNGTLLSQEIGAVERGIFATALEKVLIGRYRFSLRRREEQFQSLYYETLWVLRPPTEEEREAGIIEARHRVVLRGRRAGSSALQGSAVTYRMNLLIENQARTQANSDWHPAAALGGTLEQDMRRLASDFQLEVRAGRSR